MSRMKETWPPPMKIVEVRWVDSHVAGKWRTPQEWDEELRFSLECRTSGYLYRSTRKHVVIVQSIAAVGQLSSDAMVIPRGAVRSVTVLRSKKKG